MAFKLATLEGMEFAVKTEKDATKMGKDAEVETTVPDSSSASSAPASSDADEFLSKLLTDVDEDLRWALQNTAAGMQHDDVFRKTVCDSMEDLMEQPGIIGQFASSVKTQNSVLESMSRHDERQLELLGNMKAEESVAGKVCIQDAAYIRKKLVKFVGKVMKTTTSLDTVLMNLEEGTKAANIVRQEALKDEPNENTLRNYANRAVHHLEKAALSEKLQKQMEQVERQGKSLAKDAQKAAKGLKAFADEWQRLNLDEQERKVEVHRLEMEAKQEEVLRAKRENQIAKDASQWSLFGIVGLVGLSVVGVGIAVACAALTGGAALGPMAFMAAHVGIWAGSVVGIGCASGSVMALKQYQNRNVSAHEATASLADAEAELRELKGQQSRQQSSLDVELADLHKILEQVNAMVSDYSLLRENVKKAVAQSEILMSHLQIVLNLSVQLKNDVDAETTDLQLLCGQIVKIEETFWTKLNSGIVRTREANEKLRTLAVHCFEKYLHLGAGEADPKFFEDLKDSDSESEDE